MQGKALVPGKPSDLRPLPDQSANSSSGGMVPPFQSAQTAGAGVLFGSFCGIFRISVPGWRAMRTRGSLRRHGPRGEQTENGTPGGEGGAKGPDPIRSRSTSFDAGPLFAIVTSRASNSHCAPGESNSTQAARASHRGRGNATAGRRFLVRQLWNWLRAGSPSNGRCPSSAFSSVFAVAKLPRAKKPRLE